MATAPKANKSLKAVPDAGAAEAPGGSKKLIFIIIGVALLLVLAIGGAAAWFVMKNKHDDHSAPKVENKVPVYLTMETFIANLQVEDIPQFLQTNITLQVDSEETTELLRQNMPQARNRVLLLLSSKKSSDILTLDGKKKLAEEIIEELKRPFSAHGSKPEVTDVFFTSFVVQ
jgi:flagellar protein FliL